MWDTTLLTSWPFNGRWQIGVQWVETPCVSSGWGSGVNKTSALAWTSIAALFKPVVMGYWWPQNEFHHCLENKGISEKIVEVEYQYRLDNRVILWSGIRNELGLVYGPVRYFYGLFLCESELDLFWEPGEKIIYFSVLIGHETKRCICC